MRSADELKFDSTPQFFLFFDISKVMLCADYENLPQELAQAAIAFSTACGATFSLRIKKIFAAAHQHLRR